MGSVASSATNTGSGTTWSVNYPTGITAGETLVTYVSGDLGSCYNLTLTGGWTQLFTVRYGGPSPVPVIVSATAWWKKATGSESGSVSGSTAASDSWQAYCLRLTDVEDPTVETPVATTATGIYIPNPPILVPGGGSKNYLWLIFGGLNSEDIYGHPDFGGFLSETSGSTDSAVASLEYTASSLNPAAWYTTGPQNSIAATAAFWPETDQDVTLPSYDAAPTVHAPTLHLNVELTTLTATPTIHEPLGVGLIPVNLSTYDASPTIPTTHAVTNLTQIVTLPAAALTATIHAPNVDYDQDVTLPAIDTAPTIHTPYVVINRELYELTLRVNLVESWEALVDD